eukprot:PhM_4_TR11990/c0_g1_i1/m.63792
MTLNLASLNPISASQSNSNSNSVGVLYASFNQDSACFSVGTTRGFCIFNCDPFKETYRRAFPGGGIGIVEMMWRSNILALVGGGPNPCFPRTHVMIWDDNQISCVGELRFASDVKAVKLRRDKVLVALEGSVHVYSFHPLDVECVLETGDNPTGMLAVCPNAHVVVCTLSKTLGSVSLHNLSTDVGFLVSCHNTPVTCMTVSPDGSLLATASERGTLIRVYDTSTSHKVKEVRRGSNHATIYSLAFSPDLRFLACGSDSGTIHVFSMAECGEEHTKGSLSFMAPLSGYFASEWSFAKYTNTSQLQGKAVCVTFGAECGKLYAISSDCTYYLLRFDPQNGGVMTAEKAVTFPSGSESTNQ